MDTLNPEPGRLDTDHVEVGTLKPDDLGWVVRIDKQRTGLSRREYYALKLDEARTDTGVRISLAARIDGEPAGFMMGRLYYGEFGRPDKVAILDSLGVAEAFAGRKVGKALLRQLCMNLRGLGVEKVHTEVEWDQIDLIRFFQHSGFKLSSRLCLEMSVGE